ncbi:phage portal protein [Leuconostoc pseudomesenteroides]|nr:phage portal protein [Leuconostoc pseudomesenteroides]
MCAFLAPSKGGITYVGVFENLRLRLGKSLVGDLNAQQGQKISYLMDQLYWNTGENSGHDTLENNETIFAVISRLSNVFASLPINIISADQDESVYETQDILSFKPNPTVSAFDFWSKLETDRNLYGNAFALIEPDEFGQPKYLWNIPAEWVSPGLDENNNLWYEVRSTIKSPIPVDTPVWVSSYNMLHFKHVSRSSKLWGISPLETLTGAIAQDNGFRDFNASELRKRDGLIVDMAGNYSEEERNVIVANVKALAHGGVLFNEQGLSISNVERKLEQTDIEKNDEITNRRIANAFNVPLTFLNISDGGSYKSNEQVMQQFIQINLGPTVAQYESELNAKLFTRSQRDTDVRVMFDMNMLARGDMATRAQYYNIMIRNGLMTTQTAQRLESLPISTQPGSDLLRVSGDLYIMTDTDENRATINGKGGSTDDKLLPDESDE